MAVDHVDVDLSSQTQSLPHNEQDALLEKRFTTHSSTVPKTPVAFRKSYAFILPEQEDISSDSSNLVTTVVGEDARHVARNNHPDGFVPYSPSVLDTPLATGIAFITKSPNSARKFLFPFRPPHPFAKLDTSQQIPSTVNPLDTPRKSARGSYPRSPSTGREQQTPDLEIADLRGRYASSITAVWLGEMIGHCIALYYQGQQSELVSVLTQATCIAQQYNLRDLTGKAQLWKAIVLAEIDETANLGEILADVLILVTEHGDEMDCYQLRKLFGVYSDQIWCHLIARRKIKEAKNIPIQDLSVTSDAYTTWFQRQVSHLESRYNTDEWPDPSLAIKAGPIPLEASQTPALALGKHVKVSPLAGEEMSQGVSVAAVEDLVRQLTTLESDFKQAQERMKMLAEHNEELLEDIEYYKSRLIRADKARSDMEAANAVHELPITASDRNHSFVGSPGPITALLKQLYNPEPRAYRASPLRDRVLAKRSGSILPPARSERRSRGTSLSSQGTRKSIASYRSSLRPQPLRIRNFGGTTSSNKRSTHNREQRGSNNVLSGSQGLDSSVEKHETKDSSNDPAITGVHSLRKTRALSISTHESSISHDPPSTPSGPQLYPRRSSLPSPTSMSPLTIDHDADLMFTDTPSPSKLETRIPHFQAHLEQRRRSMSTSITSNSMHDPVSLYRSHKTATPESLGREETGNGNASQAHPSYKKSSENTQDKRKPSRSTPLAEMTEHSRSDEHDSHAPAQSTTSNSSTKSVSMSMSSGSSTPAEQLVPPATPSSGHGDRESDGSASMDISSGTSSVSVKEANNPKRLSMGKKGINIGPAQAIIATSSTLSPHAAEFKPAAISATSRVRTDSLSTFEKQMRSNLHSSTQQPQARKQHSYGASKRIKIADRSNENRVLVDNSSQVTEPLEPRTMFRTKALPQLQISPRPAGDITQFTYAHTRKGSLPNVPSPLRNTARPDDRDLLAERSATSEDEDSHQSQEIRATVESAPNQFDQSYQETKPRQLSIIDFAYVGADEESQDLYGATPYRNTSPLKPVTRDADNIYAPSKTYRSGSSFDLSHEQNHSKTQTVIPISPSKFYDDIENAYPSPTSSTSRSPDLIISPSSSTSLAGFQESAHKHHSRTSSSPTLYIPKPNGDPLRLRDRHTMSDDISPGHETKQDISRYLLHSEWFQDLVRENFDLEYEVKEMEVGPEVNFDMSGMNDDYEVKDEREGGDEYGIEKRVVGNREGQGESQSEDEMISPMGMNGGAGGGGGRAGSADGNTGQDEQVVTQELEVLRPVTYDPSEGEEDCFF